MKSNILKSVFIIGAAIFVAVGSTGAYFSHSVVVAGNKFSTGIWNKMVINEVYYSGDQEWIELYNVGTTAIDMKGWDICDNAGNCGRLNPEPKTEVAPGGYVVVSHSASDLTGWTVTSTAALVNYSGGKIAFFDNGDSVKLRDAYGNVVDQLSYGNDTSVFNPACPLVVTRHSLARKVVGVDTDTAADFIDNATPTPGA